MAEREAPKFPIGTDELLSTMARLAATKGDAFEVAILASSNEARIYASWYQPDQQLSQMFGGLFGISPGWRFKLHIRVPYWVYSRLDDYHSEHNDNTSIDISLQSYANTVLKSYGYEISEVILGPFPTNDKDWRDKAWAWLIGKKVSNQGRVRSDNIASRSRDGLLFRSEQEILLYQALKSYGVSFAPLPVFIRGGEAYRRIEPDFVILKDGIVVVVEVDGDTFHRETPVEAHDRTTMLVHEGAHVERIKASECDTPEKAKVIASKLLQIVEKLKALR